MNKLFLFVSLFFATSIFFSCDNTKTAQELLQEEKKSVERFIARNGIIVSKDTLDMYENNVYFKTKEGLYIHVITPGNGNKAKYNQKVLVRYRDQMFFKVDTTKSSNEAALNPDVFYYGNTSSYSGYSCDGWAIGLSLVGENAEVSMIVPSSLQPYSLQTSYSPMYYGYLKYRFK